MYFDILRVICRAGNGDRGAASGGVDAVRLTWWLNGLTTSICKEQQKHWLEINQWDDNLSLLCNQLCQIVQIMFITGQDLWLQQCFLKSVRKIDWYICKGCYQDLHHYLIILVHVFSWQMFDFNNMRLICFLTWADGQADWLSPMEMPLGGCTFTDLIRGCAWGDEDGHLCAWTMFDKNWFFVL